MPTCYCSLKTSALAWLLCCAMAAELRADVFEVNVQDNNFNPANLSVVAGDSVRWENNGNMNHNVASTDFNYIFRCAQGCDDTGGNGNAAGPGWVVSVTFHRPDNNIPYVCEPHVNFGMTGSISVAAPTEFETIDVSDALGFSPAEITVVEGTRIRFSNLGGVHNWVADDDAFRCADGCRDDGVEGDTEPTGFPWQFFKQFNQPGEFHFHCDNPSHNESGKIVVLADVIFANGFQ